MRWKALPIRWKLVISFTTLILFVMVVGLLGVLGITRTIDDARDVVNHDTLTDDIDNRIIDHLTWAQHISIYLAGNEQTLAIETDPLRCSFGRWYAGDARREAETRIPALAPLLKAIEDPHTRLHASAARIAACDLATAQGKREAQRIYTQETLPALTEVQSLLTRIHTTLEQDMPGDEDLTRHARTIRSVIMIIVVIALIIELILATVITRGIRIPLEKSVAFAQVVAGGDLTAEIDVRQEDELGQLAEALNTMVRNLRKIMGQMRQTATTVDGGAQALTATSRDLSSSSQEQASSVEQIAATIEEMSATVKQNATNAGTGLDKALEAQQATELSVDTIHEMEASMGEITESSRSIEAIIATVNEVAFQTNILALNAAVEAARAGEHGRGFAVVATEVRALAKRAAEASAQIKTIIEDSLQKIAAGDATITKTGQSMDVVTRQVEDLRQLVEEIAAASTEQTTGIDELNRAIAQIDASTQQNATTTEELAGTAESLSTEAGSLSAAVQNFTLAEQSAPAPQASTPAGSPAAPPVARNAAPAPRLDDGFEEF